MSLTRNLGSYCNNRRRQRHQARSSSRYLLKAGGEDDDDGGGGANSGDAAAMAQHTGEACVALLGRSEACEAAWASRSKRRHGRMIGVSAASVSWCQSQDLH